MTPNDSRSKTTVRRGVVLGVNRVLAEPVTALEEFRRVVKPGSKVLVVGPDDPKSGVFQKLADAIMLFYDEEEADRMFEAAGFVDIEHHILQRQPGSPRAIVTIARAPNNSESHGTASLHRA